MPDVAVVIPVYNGERFIRRALDSVLAQTAPATEIFVVDDGSTDRTVEIVAAYGAPVRLLRQQRQGPSRARNSGAFASSTEFVAFLDADDWWEPRKLERQVAALCEEPAATGCFTGLVNVEEATGRTEYDPPVAREHLAERLRLGNPHVIPTCLMVRRSAYVAVGGFDENLRGCEDWALAKLLHDAGPLIPLDEPLTNYRVSPGGMSGDAELVYGDFLRILEPTVLRGMTGLRRWYWRRRSLSGQAFTGAMTARAAGKHALERSFFARSIATWPLSLLEKRRLRSAIVTLVRSR